MNNKMKYIVALAFVLIAGANVYVSYGSNETTDGEEK